MFSSRLSWNPSTNRITRHIEALKQSGVELVDLTETNPTAAGFDYDAAAVCRAISPPAILEYHPSPRGLIPARQAVVDYYRHHGKAIDRETVFLTCQHQRVLRLPLQAALRSRRYGSGPPAQLSAV